MNTNALKRFATAARRKLITQVAAKLHYVLGSDSPALREQADALRQLRDELTRTPKNDLIERVAYTWFNRLVALRFLDANDYQPTGIRAVSPAEGFTTPQLLDEAKNGQIDESLPVDARRVMDLLDGRLPSRDPQNEAYQLLLIATCNALNTALPFLFEPLADYTELLMPDDLLSPQSVLGDIREGMTTEDCQQVEIIGWLYQFYISERKDAVFAAKSKVKAEDIPAATQLFTPRWVVEYMVQNTVGKLWLRNHPTSTLREKMPYYLESPSEQTPPPGPLTLEGRGGGEGSAFSSPSPAFQERGPGGEVVSLFTNAPQSLTLLDPAAGSGHILVYGFELLVHIYEEEGYSRSEIPALILEHNLMGFDIDERAAQLAAFALSMKARQYDRRFLRRGVLPRVVALHKLTHTNEADWRSLLTDVGCTYRNAGPLDPLVRDLHLMTQADNLGALIRPETPLDSLQTAADALTTYARQSTDLFRQPLAEDLATTLQHLALLAQKHSCVVANPPYMGGGAMNAMLSSFVKGRYPDSKADLMACFMESALNQCEDGGYVGMINQHTWMFMGSYEALRKKLIDSILIDTLLHLGPRTFPEIGGEVVQNVAFTFQNNCYPKAPAGRYVRLIDFNNTFEKAANIHNTLITFYASQNSFKKIDSYSLGYWLSKKVFELFETQPNTLTYAEPKQGMATSDNNRFLKLWHEITHKKFGPNFASAIEAQTSSKKWFPYNKGGGFKKWYGNNDYTVNYEDDGKEIKAFAASIHGSYSKRIFNTAYYFREGITWSSLTSGSFNARYSPSGFIFDAKGPVLFNKNSNALWYTMGFFNSIVASELLKVLSPTLDFNQGPVGRVPFIYKEEKKELINPLVQSCIAISREDWDARETSWDFQTNELLRHRVDGLLANAVAAYEAHWQGRFTQLHQNEEALNRIFIDLYGLQDELTPEVDPKDITILGQEAEPDSIGKLAFDRKELMAQFVSYAVGCMFGRYSLDKAGLILASQGQTLADYEGFCHSDEGGILNSLSSQAQDSSVVGMTKNKSPFPPDADNIIPVLDEDWFTDDIVARFRAFLRASFGDRDYNQNLAFVEDSLGMDLRKWFTKFFYDDHIRRYRRRPIYWLFQSPKGSFRALIYLHRYAPDTVARLLNGYLREYQEKLRNQRQQQLSTSLSATATAGEKTRAQKEADRLERVLAELAQYERDIIYPLATEPIAMDLDDGVLVNYNRFGAALAPVKGLTGKAGGSEDE